MTPVQLKKLVILIRDGKVPMSDVAVVIAESLVRHENETGICRHRTRSRLWYAVERLVAADPRTKTNVGGHVQTVWNHDPIPANS